MGHKLEHCDGTLLCSLYIKDSFQPFLLNTRLLQNVPVVVVDGHLNRKLFWSFPLCHLLFLIPVDPSLYLHNFLCVILFSSYCWKWR